MKHTLFIIITTLLSWLGAIPRAKAQTGLDEARQAIAASNAIYFGSFAKNDSSIFLDRYADDACILAPDVPPFVGWNGALTFFRLAYDKFGLRNGKFITTQVYGLDNKYVVEEGLWQSFDAKGKLFDDGKFLVLWKKTSKGWKMFRDSFSSNHPHPHMTCPGGTVALSIAPQG